MAYHYDALGRRTRKQVQISGKTTTTAFLWQGYRLLQEQQQNGARQTYVYDPNDIWSPLARLDQPATGSSAETYWFNTDLNGAPLEMTDEEGALRWAGHYATFGEVRNQTAQGYELRNGKPAVAQPLRYAGQYADNETGLHYNLFRYYDPAVGRFTVQDPIGLAGGDNLYQYAPNPLGWVDPLGLTTTTFYHAGDIQGEIDPSMGRSGLDFNPSGKGGFYVTTDKSQALKWAELRGHPSITQFDIPNSELDKLDIKTFKTANDDWARFVTQGRSNTLEHSYDAVSGPMLANPRRGIPKPVGSQFAIFSEKAASVFEKGRKKGCGQ